jgi:hypothetical protein
MFVRLYASGTNVQRLAKCSKKINGIIYTAYAQLEQSEPNIVRRKFFCTQVDSLKTEVEKLDVTVMPSWSKIWGRPLANEAFISNLALSLTGQNPLRSELNLSSMMGESVYCFMLLVSADKKEMKQIKEIFNRTIPDYHIKVLNGDFTTNIKAEDETIREINESKIAGKKGVVIIANQMGSRSYSVSEIQSTVIAFDRGSVDATVQKVSRCLTPGDTWTGADKAFGGIVDLSFDPNRAENIEKLILEEAILVQRAGEAEDFTKAVKFVLSSVDLFKMNDYGYAEEVTEEDMFGIFGDNDAMLRVADVSVDLVAALESGMFDILSGVTASSKPNKSKKDIVGKGVKNTVTKGATAPTQPTISDADKKKMEEIINSAIRALNMSATSVYFLANGNGESYRECLEQIAKTQNDEFVEFYGVAADDVISLLDQNILNEAILDVIVQNSQPKKIDNLFA